MCFNILFIGEICIVNSDIRFQVFLIMIQDHKHQRKSLLFLVVLMGGFVIFLLRQEGIGTYFQAIQVCSNLRNVTLSNNIGVINQLDEPRRRAIKALFISKNTLSFCKRTTHPELAYDETSLSKKLHLLTEPTRVMAYCPVPKAASTTWRTTFANMNSIEDVDIRHRTQKLYSKKNSFRAKTFGDLAQLNSLNIVKFMFVRHPFERLASAYNDKFVIYRNITRKFKGKDVKIGEMYLNNIRSNQESYMNMTSDNPCFANTSLEFTFSCFIEYVLDSANNEKLLSHAYNRIQIHWWPYTEICKVCDVQYDLIGHVENFQEDLQILLTKFHKNKFLIELYKNKTKSRCTANCEETTNDSYLKYFQQLTKGTIMRLYRRYKNDFEFGGYDFPIKYIASGT